MKTESKKRYSTMTIDQLKEEKQRLVSENPTLAGRDHWWWDASNSIDYYIFQIENQHN